MRVLVCGGRDFANRELVNAILDGAANGAGLSCVIQGGANGADKLAREWAWSREVACETFEADWSRGKAGGPIRNQRMLDDGKPELVIAFPGGAGTADMVSRANRAGIPVIHAHDVS